MSDDSEDGDPPAAEGDDSAASEAEAPIGADPEVLGVTAPDAEAESVLAFWFGELTPSQWFARDPVVDRAVSEHFALTAARVATGALPQWADSPGGVLAAVIALDQFPRNIYRGDPRAYASDDQALALAEQALARGDDAEMTAPARQFLYMPLMHAEDPEIQARAVSLFRELDLPDALAAAERHKEIIDRFGRFPHRNAVLGRTSTPAEAAFLEEPDSAF